MLPSQTKTSARLYAHKFAVMPKERLVWTALDFLLDAKARTDGNTLLELSLLELPLLKLSQSHKRRPFPFVSGHCKNMVVPKLNQERLELLCYRGVLPNWDLSGKHVLHPQPKYQGALGFWCITKNSKVMFSSTKR